MKFQNKLILSLSGFALLSFLVIAADSFYNIDSTIISNVESKIQAIASIQENRLTSVTDNYINLVAQVANRISLSNDINQYSITKNSEYINSLKARAIDAKSSVSDFEIVYILDDEAKVIATSEAGDSKTELKLEISRLSKSDKKIVVLSQDNGQSLLYLTSPVSVENQFVGYIIIKAKTTELKKITNDYSGLGNTGETTLFYRNSDGNAAYILPPRYSDNSKQLVIPKENTEIAATQALLKNETLLRNTDGYNMEPIYAVTRYFPSLDWGIVVKVDKSEVFTPIYSHALQLGVIGLLMLFVSMYMAYFVSRRVARPVKNLIMGAEEIQKGNYEYKTDIKSSDEFGQLSNAFNKMVSAVVDSRKEIDQKVQEQTKEITEKQNDMRDQQKAILNILEDIEDEKDKVGQEKDKIDAVLHSIGDGVFVIDTNYNIVIFNSIAEKLTGHSKENAVGKKYSEILKFSAEDTGITNDDFIINVIKTGLPQQSTSNTIITQKDGAKVPVTDSATPLKDKNGKTIGCVVVFRDVTQEREIDKAKTEFVSLASHQLRTPLSAINWYAEMLIAGDAGEMNEQQKQYLDEIYHGNKRMVDLVNSLLNVSRLDLGTFEINPTSVSILSVVKDVAGEMKHVIDDKKQKLTINAEGHTPNIMADQKLLRIIIQNLVSNAVKYTPEKGKIDVSITYNPSDHEKAFVIEVTDNGYGIPKSQSDKIFTKLFRADNVRSMDAEGTGLGLYIVKSIIDEVNGEITFKSVINKGTAFRVALPKSGMKEKIGTKSVE